MLFTTKADLIRGVEKRIYQVAGTGVQVYAEDIIVEFLQHKLELLFRRRWWSQFMQWHTVTLVGSGGSHSYDFSTDTNNVIHFHDIRAVFLPGKHKPLTRLHNNFNPFSLSGTTARHVEPLNTRAADYATKLFKVWPLTATGTLYVHARSFPDLLSEQGNNDEVQFDREALILGAAWEYADDDGTNPGAAEKLQTLFEQRVKDLEKAEDDKPFDLDPLSYTMPDEWFEASTLG